MASTYLFGVLIALPIGVAGLVLWVRMLTDCAENERGKSRLFWFVVLLLPNFAGVLAYYFVIWRPRRRAELGLCVR
jgi:hypothetical protein